MPTAQARRPHSVSMIVLNRHRVGYWERTQWIACAAWTDRKTVPGKGGHWQNERPRPLTGFPPYRGTAAVYGTYVKMAIGGTHKESHGSDGHIAQGGRAQQRPCQMQRANRMPLAPSPCPAGYERPSWLSDHIACARRQDRSARISGCGWRMPPLIVTLEQPVYHWHTYRRRPVPIGNGSTATLFTSAELSRSLLGACRPCWPSPIQCRKRRLAF